MSLRSTPISGAKLALLAAKARAEGPDRNILASDPVAITGIGCRFPGGVSSPEEFWTLLHSGTDAIRTVPPERWDAESYYSADPYEPGRMNSRWGGFLDDPDRFDPVFFGLSPREAASMDPQQRLLLEVSWEALWDAGQAPAKLVGSSTGVFVAVSSSDYSRLLLEEPDAIGPHTAIGSEQSMASGRISFLLDLRGPAIVLDTACSSSLIAVHLACQSLRSGECRQALAGGVTLKLTPEHYLSLSKLGMLSPDGRCMTFDARANGFVPGEGCGVVMLKRLADALADGDRIYALIRGAAINQDGRTSVITAPSGLAQQAVVRAALANARISGADLTYVETHGTGTSLGDPIEVEALSAVLDAPGAAPCALGSVKTNIGHLEVTAGVAGLIKAALALHREEIPPNLHFQSLNPHISLAGTRLFVPDRPTAWKRGGAIRFAGVSSFGFSGTNGHLILEEAPLLPTPRGSAVSTATGESILTLSARTPEALEAVAEQFRGYLDSGLGHGVSLVDICAAAACRRDHFEERLAVTGSSPDEMRTRLASVLAGEKGAGITRGRASAESPRTAFLFSGQGSQWPAMGAGLMDTEPVFRSAIEECEALARPHSNWSLMDVLRAEGTASRLDATEYAQPAICAIEIALARLLASWGIIASAVVGHSVGEIAAAQVAGSLTLAEAMRLAVMRGRVMQAAAGTGGMVSVAMPLPDLVREIEAYAGRVSIAAMNGPLNTVVSGERACIEALTAAWRGRGVEFRALPVDYAFHSAQMDPLLPLLKKTFGEVRSNVCSIPLISTVTGLEVAGTELNASYWVGAVRQPVLFRQSVEAVLARGVRCLVEIGPHPVLTHDARECAARLEASIPVLPTLRRGRPERASMLATTAGLYAAGNSPRWESIFGGKGPVIPLPPYPYQRQRYWIKPAASARARGASRQTATSSFVLMAIDSPALRERVWETTIDLRTAPFLGDHIIGDTVLFPITGCIALAIAAARELELPLPAALRDVIVREPLVLETDVPVRLQLVLDGQGLEIHYRIPTGGWRHHLSAKLLAADVTSCTPVATAADLHWTEIPNGDFYADLRQRGLAFGPAFRCIRSLRGSGGRFVESEVSLPAEWGPTSFFVHPALLDGCLQSSMVGAPIDGGRDSWLPIAIDQLTWFRPAGDSVRCQLAVHPPTSSSADTRSADFLVTTPQGERVVSGRGLLLKRVSRRREVEKRDSLTFECGWIPADVSATALSPRETAALLIGDPAGLPGELESALRSHGIRYVLHPMARSGDDAGLDGFSTVVLFAEAPASGHTIDPMAGQESGCGALLDMAQRILRRQSQSIREVWVVTCDAQRVVAEDGCAGFTHAPMWGLSRTLALEHPMTRWIRCDIDASAASRSALAGAIANGMAEDEAAFRSGRKYIPRLAPIPNMAPVEPLRLVVRERGSAANLRFEAAAKPVMLDTHQVEVEVHASALNFRDVLNVLGAYPGDAGALGAEFCGRVTRTGRGSASRFQPGERVMGISWGALSDLVVANEALITNVPAALSNEEAITLPNVFATVFHSLVEVAGLRAGERVLIHAAAGGIGMMAVQIARNLGAEVFATAGSAEKRQFLRDVGVAHVFDSRSLTFSQQILDVTGGAGVDVALNSLAGDFIGATFSAVATGGRFVEIGKSGIWPESRVAALGKQIRYTVVDLGVFVDRAPDRIADLFRRMHEYLEAGAIRPLPRHEFRFEEAPSAFRFMERGRHTGKIVLRHRAGRGVPASSGTWMITGGLGSLGLELAEWLGSRGVARLLLLGRHAPSVAAMQRIEDLRRSGVQVETHEIDVASDNAFDTLDALVVRDLGLRIVTIAHLAGVVDDGVAEQQTWERFHRVLDPKVKGAWQAHRFAERHGIPQLLLFSSISATLGSPGQSSYAAANAFLDSLAAYRTGRGEQAISIAWGAWEGAGMAARLDAGGKRLGLGFIRGMAASECLASMPAVFENGAHHAAVFAVRTPVDSTGGEARLRSLLPPEASTHGARQPAPEVAAPKFADRIEGLSRPRARKLLLEHLRDETRLVLGLDASHPIDEWQPLMKMGLDSLMALEMRNRIAAAFGRPFTATLLFDRPTIGALADFLLPDEAPQTEVPKDDLFDELSALSDEEAERLLEAELEARK